MTNTDFAETQAKLVALAEAALEIERLDEFVEMTLGTSPESADLAIAAAAFQRSAAILLAVDGTASDGG